MNEYGGVKVTFMAAGDAYGTVFERLTIEMSESTLYTILKRLEAAEMLSVRSAEHDGRLRKYYHITRAGLKRIEEFREDWKEILSIYQFVTKEDQP